MIKQTKKTKQKSSDNEIIAVLTGVEEPAVCSYVFTVCTKHACEAGSSGTQTSIKHLLAPLEGSCFRRVDGWWTYEFCHGKYLRQMHIHVEENGQSTSRQVQASYDLGRLKSPASAADVDDSEAILRPPSNPDMVAYAVSYGHGDKCGITGGARSAEIYYVCKGAENPTYLVSVKEDSTCRYIAVVHTPYICQHPKFSELQEKSSAVSCRLRSVVARSAARDAPESKQ